MNGVLEVAVTVESYLSGLRIDSFLLRHFRTYTNFRMQRIVQTGNVRIRNAVVPLSQRVFVGEIVSVRLVEPPDKLHDAEPLPISIVYEDAWILVVEKPPGMVAHPVGAHQSGTLCNALQWHLDQIAIRRGVLRAGIVHRLDRMTSGLMVVAKDHLSHRRMSIDFQNGNVSKKYLAIVEGQPPESGLIDLPIGRALNSDSILMATGEKAERPRAASTQFEVVQREADVSVVRATPFTGRNHQIRVHLAAIGCPVVGDEYYAADGVIKPRRPEAFAAPSRHALHAAVLKITHPITGVEMEFLSEMPADMRRMIEND